MRPLKLTMTAFGPYRDTETIDFGQLEDRRLFVISGNTGAGKTSIFDAICFAIYGSASGEDRSDPRMLRSHFAEEDTHTAVSFEFAVGRRSFLVMRQMPHRKGGNKSETGGKAELYETTDGEAVPAVDRFAVSDVNAKLEAIIGLTKDQFSQIVMLPQGEFRKLLTSDTDNKEEILRKIFRTELYERLESRFQQKNRELHDLLKDERATESAYMKQAREALPVREDGGLARTFRQEAYSAAQVLEALEEELAHYGSLAAASERRKGEMAAELELGENRLREAIALNAKHDELERKQSQYEQLDARKEEYETKERRLALADRAARLEPYEEQAERAKADAEAKRSRLAIRQESLEAADRASALAAEQFRTEELREGERRQAEQELHRLTELAPAVRALARQRQEVETLLKEEQGCGAKLAACETELARLREAKQALGIRIKETESETVPLAGKLDRLRQIEQQGKQLKRLADIEKELARIAQLETAFRQSMEQARLEHERLETAWIEGQASMLAAHLHDGKPCPVCGSESHPAKAEPAADVPSRERLQQSKEQLGAAERELAEASAQAAAALAAREEGAKELAEYGVQARNPEEQRGMLLQQWRQLKEETDRLQAKVQQLPDMRSEAEGLEQLLEKQLAERERRQQQQQRLVIDRTTRQSALQQELDRIPEQLRTSERLEAKLAEQRALADRLNAAWKLAQERLQAASTKLAEQKAYAEQAAQQLVEAESSLVAAQERQREELLKAGFDDAGHYREAAMAAPDREAVRTELDSYRQAAALLERQLAELRQELDGKPRIDIAGLQERLADLKRRLEQAIKDAESALRIGREAQRLSASIAEASGRVRALEAMLEEVMDVYQMLKGDNALKISFERYILIEFLEHILYAANERLKGLSNGQFELQRSDRLETRGKQSGLGLDVYDAYTGQNRDVKTLSGGEKFNASLCLALGMTDVIQSHQGGVSIEMMFIDEGFGSLDEESLQKAIAALVDLQKAGRMIGVISHVQELKDAFPACLEVNKTKEGFSRTRMTLK
ncbi:SbcC/MukB-like Walker B domain-containing protein [Paenibacillus arenilitoris]|uniref:Nuclease SbcCD subunit C n=1 Tax=Paenibacillus arenilitoris TaxID=2772299 RepID=A0A927CSV0_9BACL|nr:SMC family ATPase [Paenibacillus arenilitoris]MBD2872587.1 SMC family ATPase [Paenibacillus arenilitoris]